MKKITILIGIILIGLITNCKKHKVNPKDVVEIMATESHLNADGTSELKIVASIPLKATSDKREITFNTSIGNFKNGTNGTLKLTADDKDIVDGKLSAIAYLIAPTELGDVIVKASISDFSDEVSISLNKVIASEIDLSADVFAVKVNYGGNVNLTAKLGSSSGGLVSQGNKVKFIDTDLNSNPINGTFEQTIISSNDKSQATTKYTPGLIAPGNYIYIKAIYLNDSGIETNVRDSVKVYLLP